MYFLHSRNLFKKPCSYINPCLPPFHAFLSSSFFYFLNNYFKTIFITLRCQNDRDKKKSPSGIRPRLINVAIELFVTHIYIFKRIQHTQKALEELRVNYSETNPNYPYLPAHNNINDQFFKRQQLPSPMQA